MKNWRFVLTKLTGAALGFVTVLISASMCAAQPRSAISTSDPRLQKAYRFQQGGWTYVHLEGSPADIGFQHGYLLAR